MNETSCRAAPGIALGSEEAGQREMHPQTRLFSVDRGSCHREASLVFHGIGSEDSVIEDKLLGIERVTTADPRSADGVVGCWSRDIGENRRALPQWENG